MMDNWGSMVDSVVDNWSGVVDSMVDWSRMVNHWSSVDESGHHWLFLLLRHLLLLWLFTSCHSFCFS